MKIIRILAAGCFALFAFMGTANAQGTTPIVLPGGCGTGAAGSPSLAYLTVDSTLKLCVNATVTAAVSGFTPGGTFATLTATGSSASVALPAGVTVAIQNTGTTAVSCTLGIGSATAVASEIIVQAASTVFVTPGTNTFGACIDQTGSASNVVVLAGGAGLGTGFGGGSGGGGGGLSVVDQTAFTQGTSAFTPGGGVFNDTATLSSGQEGTHRLTTKRAQVVDVDSTGNQLHTDLTSPSAALAATASNTNTYTTGSTSPINMDLNGGLFTNAGLNRVNGVSLGSPTAFGTSPGAVNVPGANVYNFVTDQVGGAATALVGDPCQTTAKTTVPITLATAAVKVIATGVSAKKIYVCHLYLNNNAADTIAVFEATTATTCATSAVAMIGAGTSVATAGTGNNFGATGGVNMGVGGFQVLQTTVNNNDICVAQSAATQLSGSITYVTR